MKVLIFNRLGMKKIFSKILPACVIVFVVLLILLGLRSIAGDGTAPSYRFLGGRDPITCKIANRGTEDSRGKEDKRYTYSFEADFNDLCSKADAELIGAGFVDESFPGYESFGRVYLLKNRFPRGPVGIVIYSDEQYLELPDSKEGSFCEKDGWVMVEVVYCRGWQWPF